MLVFPKLLTNFVRFCRLDPWNERQQQYYFYVQKYITSWFAQEAEVCSVPLCKILEERIRSIYLTAKGCSHTTSSSLCKMLLPKEVTNLLPLDLGSNEVWWKDVKNILKITFFWKRCTLLQYFVDTVGHPLELQVHLHLNVFWTRFHLPFTVQAVCSCVPQLMLLRLKQLNLD